MDDGNKNFLDSLKSEWKLLWASLTEQSQPQKEDEPKFFISLSDERLPQVETLLKDLSSERHKLNLKLEDLKSQIDDTLEKQNLLKMVGQPTDSVELHLEHLQDAGMIIQKELEEINDCLEEAKAIERSEDLGLF